MTTLSLGFSPCPNDTFIFDALIHHKIDTEGLNFDVVFADVEALNQMAFQQQLDITKLSYHAYAYAQQHYVLLNSGSALGNNCGPLLIAKQELSESVLNQSKIAIPGKYTTANFLLKLAYPDLQQTQELLFSEIESAVLTDKVEAGLIIHENRFTYQDKGLIKLRDLGEYWETQTGLPIPLGGIVASRTMDEALLVKVDRVLRRSVEYAFANPDASQEFVELHAQEMEIEVMRAHINLYVNDFSIDLGERGRAAIEQLFRIASERQVIPSHDTNLFIN